MNNNFYDSEPKRNWRNWTYNSLSKNNTFYITDDSNNFRGKRVELIAENAICFNQILKTGRIKEEQLIGINTNIDIINSAKKLYPNASYYHGTWESFCQKDLAKEVNVYCFDSLYAGFGDKAKHGFNTTIKSMLRNKKYLKEIALIFNVDAGKTYRQSSFKKGLTVEQDFTNFLNGCLNGYDLEITNDKFYKYKQSKQNTEMISTIIKI